MSRVLEDYFPTSAILGVEKYWSFCRCNQTSREYHQDINWDIRDGIRDGLNRGQNRSVIWKIRPTILRSQHSNDPAGGYNLASFSFSGKMCKLWGWIVWLCQWVRVRYEPALASSPHHLYTVRVDRDHHTSFTDATSHYHWNIMKLTSTFMYFDLSSVEL